MYIEMKGSARESCSEAWRFNPSLLRLLHSHQKLPTSRRATRCASTRRCAAADDAGKSLMCMDVFIIEFIVLLRAAV
jgi:hypothetical protein